MTSTARVSSLTSIPRDAFEEIHLSGTPDNFGWYRKLMDMDSFFRGLYDFLEVGRHFRSCPSVEDAYRLASQADTGPGCVNGRVSATDDRYPVGRFHLLAERHVFEKG